MNEARRIWQPPALRRDEEFELHRAVTWLELFFDLVFVVLVSRLAHDLADHVDGRGLVTFLRAVRGRVLGVERVHVPRRAIRVGRSGDAAFAFVSLVAVAAMAIWAHDGLGDQATGFAVAYLSTRAVNMAQWARRRGPRRTVPPVAYRFFVGFAVAAGLILVGLGVSDERGSGCGSRRSRSRC